MGADLKGIGKILSSYDSNELVRLKQIISTCQRPEAVVCCVSSITSNTRWHTPIREVFFQFGKTGNPLANKEEQFMDLLATTGYSLEGMQPIAELPKKSTDVQKQRFENFTLDLAAYWIYRVRSSIAHSRIGEYVMRSEDEAFVVEFAEALLRCVLGEVLR